MVHVGFYSVFLLDSGSLAVLVTGKTCAICALKCTGKRAAGSQEQCVYGFLCGGESVCFLLTFPDLHRYLLSFSDEPVFPSTRAFE